MSRLAVVLPAAALAVVLPATAAVGAPVAPRPVAATSPAAGASAWLTTAPVVVTAPAGTRLVVVRLVPLAGGAPTGGRVDATRRTWTSGAELRPRTTYRLVAAVVPAAPTPTSAPARVVLDTRLRTGTPPRTFSAVVAVPAAGAVVGVGMPVVVRFTKPVTDRRAVQRALTVTTSRPVGPAAWSWLSATEVHYRPKVYWPAGTRVTVTARLTGVRGALGTWGWRDTTSGFATGRAQIYRVVNATHRMTVYRNRRAIRVIPVSLGKPGFPTRSGIKILTTRYASLRMRSTSIGIPAGSPESYDVVAPYAVQLTPSGEYVHGAPWNRYIGVMNRSHGCTNLRVVDAKWIYDTYLPGDPVETVGTGRPMEPRNGLGGDWDVSWATWLKGSAA